MTRRGVLQLTAFAGLASLLPKLSMAEEVLSLTAAGANREAVVSAEITSNHGHEFALDPVAALELLRQTKQGQAVTSSIKGQSSHPHSLELTHADLLALFVEGQIVKESTRELGHQHQVTIRLEIVG